MTTTDSPMTLLIEILIIFGIVGLIFAAKAISEYFKKWWPK